MAWLVLIGIVWLIASSIMLHSMYALHWNNFMKCDKSPFYIVAFCVTALALTLVVPPLMVAPLWIAGVIDLIFFSNKEGQEGACDNQTGPAETWMNKQWHRLAELPGRLL